MKYRELVLNELSGFAAYRTKAHVDVIPAAGDVVVTADNRVGLLRSDRSKMKKN